MARSVRRTSNRRRGYRTNDIPVMADDEAIMAEELAIQMEDIAVEMADEIAAEFEDEAALQAEEDAMEKAAARSLRRRAVRRALRQLEATDDVQSNIANAVPTNEGGTGELDPDYLGDASNTNPPIENFKRYGTRRRPVRGVARRGFEDDAILADEEAIMAEAEEIKRTRARRGYGYRAEDEAIMAEEEEVKRLRRARARRSALRTEDTAYNSADEEIKSQDDAIMLEEVAAASYRNGYRKGVRRAYRTTDDTGTGSMPDAQIGELNDETGNYDEIPMDGADITTAQTVTEGPSETLKRLRNSRARRNLTEAEKEEEEAAKAFRRGYRSAVSRARRNTEEALMSDPYMIDEQPIMGEDESMMFDDAMLVDESYASEDMMDEPVRRYGKKRATGRNFRGKSAAGGYGASDFDNQANYWKQRAMKAETMEAPSQRRFGSVKTTDVADRQGAYSGAFKSYLYRGLGLMTDTEKYVLRGKGQVDWKNEAGQDARVKTYFGGADSSVGFAVPPDWVAELNKNIMTQTVMAPECRTRTTTSDRIVQPNLITTDARRSHAAQVRWPGEVISSGNEHRTIEDQLSQVDVPIHVMLLSLTAGNSALEDVTYSLEDEINEAFSEAVAIEYDSLIWAGDGQGKMQGIVVNNQVVGSRSLNMQTVSGYVPSGSPDGIVTADTLKEMLFHLPRGYRQRAKWYMNSNTGLQIATLKDGEGNYLIDQRDESIQSVGVPDMLLGRPIVYNEYADDITEDAFPIVLGDLSRGYLIGKRVDFSIRRFDDSGYAELDQVLFLGRARLGGQVLQPASMKVLKVAAS